MTQGGDPGDRRSTAPARPTRALGRERGGESAADPTPTARTIVPPLPPREPGNGGWAGLIARVQQLGVWLQATRPMRAFKRFGDSGGGILAAGMAYSGLFSAFAAIWVFFSIAGIVLAGSPELIDAVIGYMSGIVPGLVGEDAIISPETLKNAGTSFTIAGSIALVSMLWTAMSWFAGTRSSIRILFEVSPQPRLNMLVTRLLDLGLMLVFAVAITLSAAITAVSSSLASVIGDRLGLAAGVSLVVRLVSLVVSLALDTTVIAGVVRVSAVLRIPARILWSGALLGGIGVTILKQLGTALIGGASSNPLLATFAALLGVMIFFNLLCTVLLLTASWIKVTMDDRGENAEPRTRAEAERLAREATEEARYQGLYALQIALREQLRQTPRWRRRKLRKRYERTSADFEALEQERLRQRLGIDPVTGVVLDDAPDAAAERP